MRPARRDHPRTLEDWRSEFLLYLTGVEKMTGDKADRIADKAYASLPTDYHGSRGDGMAFTGGPESPAARTAVLTAGTAEFQGAVTEINERIHSDPAWRLAALLAIRHARRVSASEPRAIAREDRRWRRRVESWLLAPVSARLKVSELNADLMPFFDAVAFLFALRWLTSGVRPARTRRYLEGVAGRPVAVAVPRAAGLARLSGLARIAAPRRPVPIAPLSRFVAEWAGALIADDSSALARLRWCAFVRCTTERHRCAGPTGGPLFVDRGQGQKRLSGQGQRRQREPAHSCCKTHRQRRHEALKAAKVPPPA